MRVSYGLSPGLALMPERSSNLFLASTDSITGFIVCLLRTKRAGADVEYSFFSRGRRLDGEYVCTVSKPMPPLSVVDIV